MSNPKIQLRHDTAANWSSVNPVLLAGEVGIELNPASYLTNIELTGSLIEDNDGILSSFEYDNYGNITTSIIPNPSEIIFTTKVNLTSYSGYHDDIISNKSSVRPIGFTNGYLGIWNGSNWQYGSAQYPINTNIWVKAIHTNGTISIYGLIDNGYTFTTLPDISNWTLETQWNTGDRDNILLGEDWIGTSESKEEWFHGTIDLNETYMYADGMKLYQYKDTVSNNRIKIGDGTTPWNSLPYFRIV